VPGVADICRRVESTLADGDREPVSGLLKDLAAEWLLARAALKDSLSAKLS